MNKSHIIAVRKWHGKGRHVKSLSLQLTVKNPPAWKHYLMLLLASSRNAVRCGGVVEDDYLYHG